MLNSGQQTVMDEYAKKLYLPEEHLIVKSTMTRGLCTRRGKRMTHKVDNLLYRVHGGKTKKKWHNW